MFKGYQEKIPARNYPLQQTGSAAIFISSLLLDTLCACPNAWRYARMDVFITMLIRDISQIGPMTSDVVSAIRLILLA